MKQILFLVLITFHLETVLAHITWKLEGIMRIGKTMTLTCTVHNVDTIDQQLTRQWSNGGKLISYNGHSLNPSKYIEKLTAKNEFSLLIKKLTMSDVTSIYQCLYSFETCTKGLEINPDNFEYPPNDETTQVTYSNTDDGHHCLQLHFSQVYPLPHCRIEIQGKQFDFQDISVTNHTNYIDINFTYVYEQDIKCGTNPKIACQLIEFYPVHIEERTPCTRNTSVLMMILFVSGSIILIASIMLCIWRVRKRRKLAESMMQDIVVEEQGHQPTFEIRSDLSWIMDK